MKNGKIIISFARREVEYVCLSWHSFLLLSTFETVVFLRIYLEICSYLFVCYEGADFVRAKWLLLQVHVFSHEMHIFPIDNMSSEIILYYIQQKRRFIRGLMSKKQTPNLTSLPLLFFFFFISDHPQSIYWNHSESDKQLCKSFEFNHRHLFISLARH